MIALNMRLLIFGVGLILAHVALEPQVRCSYAEPEIV